MQLDSKYENPYEGFMGEAKANYSRQCDLYATTPDAEFYVERGDSSEINMETTPYYLERIFYNNMKGLAQVREYFKKENVLELFPCNDKLTYYFRSHGDVAGGNVNNQQDILTINLYGRTQDEEHIHEAIHLFTVPFEALRKDKTLSEGLARYVEDIISKEYTSEYLYIKDSNYCVGNTLYEHFNDPADDLDKEVVEARKLLREYYLAQGGKLDTQEEFDGLLYADAFTHAMYTKLMSGKLSKDEEYWLVNYYSYFFDEAFVHYLTDTYSFKKVVELFLGVQNGESYEQIMGKSEDELKVEWLHKMGVD